MTFHNYAKRLKYSDSDDDTDKCMSTSSESNENSVSSTLSAFNEERENIQICRHIFHPVALAPISPSAFSPVSSTTGSTSFYHRFPKVPLRSVVNPYYQKDLIEIAMKTIILLHKNRSLHARLHQLKLETRAFVNSVMSNPENAKLRETLSTTNERSLGATAIKILGLKNN